MPVAVPVIERWVCSPESQVDYFEWFHSKAGQELSHGYRIGARPYVLSFGEDYDFMESRFVENPGQLLISNNDLMYAEAFDRVPGQTYFSITDFSAKFAHASQIVKKSNVQLWGIRQHIRFGGPHYGLASQPSASSRDNGYLDVGLSYIRNFIVIMKQIGNQAQGSWKPWNLLEDLSRTLSAHHLNPSAVAEYQGMMIRYEDATCYQNKPEWQSNRLSLIAEYGEAAFRECVQGGTPPNKKKGI